MATSSPPATTNPTAASAAMSLPPSTALALDFEVLLTRDLQDHRPARVTRMVPRERFVPAVKTVDASNNANSMIDGNSTNQALLAHQQGPTNAADGGIASNIIEGGGADGCGGVDGVGGVHGSMAYQKQQESNDANKLVRTLVATTPAFVQHMEATHASAEDEEKREWKASLAHRTRLLLEELTGSRPDATPLVPAFVSEYDDEYSDEYDDDDLDDNNNNNQDEDNDAALQRRRDKIKNKHKHKNRSRFDSKLHGVEMSDWESKIQWDGVQQVEETAVAAAGAATTTPATTTELTDRKPLTTDPMLILHQRRNHWLDTLEFDNTVNWEGTLSTKQPRPIPLLLELGVAGQSVARHVFPSQRPPPGMQSEEYKQRMDREWQDGSQAITSTADVNRVGSLYADREKMEKLIAQRQKKRAQMAVDKTDRVSEAMGTLAIGPGKGRTITSSLMGPGGTERTGRPSRHNVGTTSVHELEFMDQLDMVVNHSLVRDLSKVSQREYHRPKMPRNVVRQSLQWQFQIRYLATIAGGSSKPSGVPGGGGRGNSTSYQNLMMGSHPGAMSKAKLRSEADLSPSEGKLVLLEYCEERPPIQLTKGMASKIVNYFRGEKARCPVSRGGGDRPTRKKKRSENESPNKVKSTSKTLFGDRPPRLEGPDKALKATAADWIGKIPKKTREGDAAAKNNMVDMLPEGVTEMLHPKVHGPFVGEVDENTNISALISLLFVAPLFRQEPEQTDFIMVLGRPAGGGVSRPGMTESLGVMLRDFPTSIYTVGQCEPRTRVYAPNTQGEKNFLGPFLSYQIAKILARTQAREGHGMRFDEILRVMPNFGLPDNAVRPRLKQVALYNKETGIWTTKSIGYEDYPGVDALGKSIAPEGVAAFETASAAARRLMDLGINQLFAGSHSVGSVGMTMTYLAGQMNAAKEMHRKAKKMYELSRTNKGLKPAQVMFYEKAAAHLELHWKCLRQRYDVGKFIYEELQLAPWHLTGEFIEVHKKGEGSGMMKLTGLGDPSGLGEGFSFLREADNKPSKAAAAGALNAQMKKITGTEDDLRKLTMKQMAALLRSYGMAQKQIDTLKRWDRVHVIRDLSTKAASDGIGDGLERFARGEKMKLSEQKQVYRKRIQVIWKRQIAALSGIGGDGGAGAADAAGVAVGEVEADPAVAAAGGPAATNKGLQKKESKKDDSDSDSDDDDDFAATFEEEMMDTSEANQLVAAHARGGESGEAERESGLGQLRAAVQDQDVNKDARELAALQRQRAEERAAFATAGKKEAAPVEPKNVAVIPNRKVIRKKVVKTFPDGRVATTFKFICRPNEVGKVMAKISERKEKGKEKPRKLELIKYERGREEKPAGHAMFEDEDDFDYATSKRYGTKRGRGRGRGGRMGTSTGAKRGPKPRTLQLGKLKTKVSKEQRMKKRKREDEEAEVYETVAKRKGTSNRRERGSIRDRRPHVIFAERLESIRAMVESRPMAGPFMKPVNRRQLPGYYEVISYPMDLSTIRDKIQRYEYRTAEAFVKDFELMKTNAVKFNGAGTQISDEAVTIWEAVKEQVDASQSEMKMHEEAVKEQLSGKPKKKKKNKKKGKKSGDGMIGGVNLGDIDFNFDDIGSSSDEDGF